MPLVREYGAAEVINHAEESIRDRVRELTDGRGAEVIYDPVGGDAFDESMRCINWNGRILVVGFAAGRIPQLPLNLPLLKNCSVVGVFTGGWADRFPEENIRVSEEIMALAAEGSIKPHVSRVLPLEQVADVGTDACGPRDDDLLDRGGTQEPAREVEQRAKRRHVGVLEHGEDHRVVLPDDVQPVRDYDLRFT